MPINLKGIQIGQKARTRDGRELTLVEINEGRTYPYIFLTSEGGKVCSYTEAGTYWSGERVKSNADIVALLPPPSTPAAIDLSNIQPGQRVLLRDGGWLEYKGPTENGRYPYRFVDQSGATTTFTPEGRYYAGSECAGDIVKILPFVNLQGIQSGTRARTKNGLELIYDGFKEKAKWYPYRFKEVGSDAERSYTPFGYYSMEGENNYDLVELIIQPQTPAATPAAIDLSTAQPGDQFRSANGTVFTFMNTFDDPTDYPYRLESDETGSESFTRDGFYFSDKRLFELNLVEALRTEKPPEIDLDGIATGQKVVTRKGDELTYFGLRSDGDSDEYPYYFKGPGLDFRFYSVSGKRINANYEDAIVKILPLEAKPEESPALDISSLVIGQKVENRRGEELKLVDIRQSSLETYPYRFEASVGARRYYNSAGKRVSGGDEQDIVKILPVEATSEQPAPPAPTPEIDLSALAPGTVVCTRAGKKLIFKGKRDDANNGQLIYPYYCLSPGSEQKFTYTRTGKYTSYSTPQADDIVEILSTGPEQPDAVTQDGTVFDFKTEVNSPTVLTATNFKIDFAGFQAADRSVATRIAVADRAARAMQAADAQAARDLATAGITDVRNIPAPSNPMPARDTSAYGTEHLDRMRSLREVHREALSRAEAGLNLLLDAVEKSADKCSNSHPELDRANRKLRASIEDAMDDIDRALKKHLRKVERLIAEGVK